MTQVKYMPVVRTWWEYYYNWRWLQAYYWHQKRGATVKQAYDCADGECASPMIYWLWNGDYSDVLPAEQREDWVGE